MTADRKKLMNTLKYFGCGVVIGAAMLIPGVSGGTTAIILGIYDDLIRAVSKLFKSPVKNILFLLIIGTGGLLGAALFSGMILELIGQFPSEAMFFFIGAIIGSVPLLVKKSGITLDRSYHLCFALLGAVAAVGVKFLPEASQSNGNILMLILSGGIIAAAMVLPGISTSHILLVMGMYETVWGALHSMKLELLVPLATGGLIGTLLTAKLTDRAAERFPCQTYMAIVGFVMTSAYDILPRFVSVSDLPVCILLCAVGAAAVYLLTSKSAA